MYEYRCTKCNHIFEKIQKFSDPPITKCPKCGAKVEQVISAPAMQFKGTGWYVNDYAKKGSNGSKSGSDVSSSSSESSSTSSSGDSKSESKSSESKPSETKSSGNSESKPSASKSDNSSKP